MGNYKFNPLLDWNLDLNTGGGGGGAPANAEYLVGALDGTLTNERLVTATATVSWDLATAGQAKANVIDASITNTKLATMAAATIKGNNTGAVGSPLDLTATQTTAMLDVFTAALKGLAPASGGGTSNFLRADGTWASPPGTGAPVGAQYLVAALDGTLTNERLATDTATVAWDFTVAGAASANVPDNAITNLKLRDSAGFSVIGKFTTGVGDPADIVAADETVLGRTGGGNIAFAQVATGQVANNAITYAKMQDVTATSRFIGRITAGAGDPEELTGTQATTLLDIFTTALKGLAPASGGGTTNFLRADGTWATPGGGGGGGATFGAATINFGSFPGSGQAEVAVTGQAGITGASRVLAWLFPATTADHSSDEHLFETIKIIVGNIVAGVGFTIFGENSNQLNEPSLPGITSGEGWSGASKQTGGTGRGYAKETRPTRIYGQWNVAWMWA